MPVSIHVFQLHTQCFSVSLLHLIIEHTHLAYSLYSKEI